MEIEEANSLYTKLEEQRLNEAMGDLMLWKLDRKGEFSVKSCYELGCMRRESKIQILWDINIPQELVFLYGKHGAVNHDIRQCRKKGSSACQQMLPLSM